MKQAIIAGTLLVLGLALGCSSSSDNSLDGSMSQVYDLSFDSVDIKRVGDSVAIEYVNGGGKTAKLVVNLAGVVTPKGTSIDLTELVSGAPRGTLQRVQATGTTDYKLQRGTVQFDQAPDLGADVTGHFNTTLVDPAGRTLNGTFSAKVTAP